ncbi:MAG: beta-glucosidase [Thermogemmatispora sp.]|uniref:GH1 family beta-glucosidase n=1 Tax=Thermogemmatispora sp. TaxID=1968838 RepID=UPI002636A153|nr:GH1 family beta-glucosidase [Thermogemmatispora sp.]MBX5456498.1 beta-glucosidase [Thermogemmatispora sp.]
MGQPARSAPDRQLHSDTLEISASFPPDFLWGVATSAYQIEGAAYEDGRGPSIWDAFSGTPGKTYQGDTGDIAADHYHRMEEDVALMARLGIGAYRFSISWPRVLPQGKGSVNSRGLDFYERLVDCLLAHEITPLITLFHWDLPLALQSDGGWLNRETALAFADYAEIVARRLGDRVRWWATLNEPWCSAYLGHGSGEHAPGLRDLQAAITAGHHLLLAHGLALPRLRAHTRSDAQLGIVLNFTPVYPADEQPETQESAQQADAFHNLWFIEPLYCARYPEALFSALQVQPPAMEASDLELIAAPLDFLGVNYYTRLLVRAHAPANEGPISSRLAYETVAPVPGSSYTEMGWEVYPSGLKDLLLRLQHEYQPKAMVVTENGAAFHDEWDGNEHIHDGCRVAYLRQHIQALGEALASGAAVRGYFVWSLLDNFEWAFGYSKRFGIVYVDYPTQRRIVKDSGYWYASFIAARRPRS